MTDPTKMPFQVWILTLAAFAIGTAEFVIAGILAQVAESLAISEGQTGSLITAYALAIVVGGPLLTLWLTHGVCSYPARSARQVLMRFCTANSCSGGGLSIRLERRQPDDRRPVSTSPSLPRETR